MKIDPEKKYSISEISEVTGYPNHVLRYYEKEFDLQIPRNSANHRYYTYKEIETFNYIKSLQEKGFTNKQIKLILNSPEVLVSDNEQETAVTTIISKDNPTNTINEITDYIKEIIVNELQPKLLEKESKNIEAINKLKDEIKELKNEIRSKERDILICENAKLKMKFKEKSYEVAELKEKLKRERENNKSIFNRIFKFK